MSKKACYHCGDECGTSKVELEDKIFCCNGCKTVFEIFNDHDLTAYYDLQNAPGASPSSIENKYDFLNQEGIVKKLTEFKNDTLEIATLYIPHIHCSSCIWMLENLNKLNPHILSAQVNFGKKTVRVTYNHHDTNLKAVVLLLSKIGYEPYISLEDYSSGKKRINRSLIYKLGIAGFSFGNIMFLSFPEYFELKEYWLEQYKHFFRWLMFALALPLVFYASKDYFTSAIKGLRARLLNIDVPIALGISVLFIRSTLEIVLDIGSGFFDSLAGLVFFLL